MSHKYRVTGEGTPNPMIDWQAAAIRERILRVEAEKEIEHLKEMVESYRSAVSELYSWTKGVKLEEPLSGGVRPD